MSFSPSTNIKRDINSKQNYIATPNAKNVLNQIVNSYQSGIHSFNMIGSYGTGKSSFILALQKDLKFNTNVLVDNKRLFSEFKDFEFVNIIGDYASVESLIIHDLGTSDFGDENFLDLLDKKYREVTRKNKLLFIVIDEFGKVLEHAAKNNPEKELYTLQKLAEYVNDTEKNILLLTTLHQNFGSYSKLLTKEQRSEWEKVRGRFKEVVFNEPVEQLLYLAADRLKQKIKGFDDPQRYIDLYRLAVDCKFINTLNFSEDLALSLAPLDVFSAYCLVLAIQRYGQNERSLFTFLESKGAKSILEHEPGDYETYNLASIYDYIVQNFYSYLSEVNADSVNWMALKVALERVEGNFGPERIVDAIKLIKSIGLLNIFASQASSSKESFLLNYAENALGIKDTKVLIERLVALKIIRYAQYRSQYILYSGTDIDIEAELLAAGSKVPRVTHFIEKLNGFFEFNVVAPKSIYYATGTPRYFEYIISEHPIADSPKDDIDGFVNILFDNYLSLEEILSFSKESPHAILFAYYQNSKQIIDQIFEIDKYQYLLDYVVIDQVDNVARLEIEKELLSQKNKLNKLILDKLYSGSSDIVWVFKGQKLDINNRTDFNKQLSSICGVVYSKVPHFKNELVNKFKPSGTISTARSILLNNLLLNEEQIDLGFPPDKFPPEKSIYLSLFVKTGIHSYREGIGELGRPTDQTFMPLWDMCEAFLASTVSKQRKLTELIKMLQKAPFKLKQGFIDIWIPSFLIIKRESYALYCEGKYIPFINKEVLDLIQRVPKDFTIKAFDISGVRLDIFNKYRSASNLSDKHSIEGDSFIETIKPFLVFYRSLKEYAKKTNKLQRQTIEFRNVLAKAIDPQQTFFEDLPRALGFKEADLSSNEEFLRDFVQILQDSRHELSTCFDELINRVEDFVLDSIGITEREYDVYKPLIAHKYANIKQHLLPVKLKAFYSRVMSPLKDRDAWICSITYGIFNKPLENLLDEEEEALLDKLKYSFFELADFVDLHAVSCDESADEVIKVTTTTNRDGMRTNQIIIPRRDEGKCNDIESKIKQLLSGDDMIDIYALARILNEKLGKK